MRFSRNTTIVFAAAVYIASSSAYASKIGRKKRKLRGLQQSNDVSKVEDIEFWTNFFRNTDMSMPEENCDVGAPCRQEGASCTVGTESCCGETFDSFVCECANDGGVLAYQCYFTDACFRPFCDTFPPTGLSNPTPPSPTPPSSTELPTVDAGTPATPNPTEPRTSDTPNPTDPRIPDTPAPDTTPPTPTPPTPPTPPAFICPDSGFVGCTAPDPTNPVDECATVGEPCTRGNPGEFCCRDGCPRNYCTAKPGP